MSRAGLLKARRGVESGSVVVLFTRRMRVMLLRSNGSLITIESRFDTTTVEAEGMPPWGEKYLA
jgi:hypothetical protein